MTMTPRQADLLKFIRSYVEHTDGVAPSFDEMAKGLGIKSKSGIYRMVSALEDRGYIRRNPRMKRHIEITPKVDHPGEERPHTPVVELERAIQHLEASAGTNITLEVLQAWAEIYRLKIAPEASVAVA